MEQYDEARQWYSIIAQYPAWSKGYSDISVSVEFDQMNDEYQRLLAGRTLIRSVERELNILEQLTEYRAAVGTIRDDEPLILHGHGIYISQDSGDIGFLNEVAGISGEFGGYTLNAVPPLSDFLQATSQKELVNRTLLSVELGHYVIHQLNGVATRYDDDVLSIPIQMQDMVTLRHQERYVG